MELSFYISQLIQKHLHAGLSVIEKETLDAWVQQSDDNRQAFEELTNPQYIATGLQKMGTYNEAAGKEKIAALYPEYKAPVVNLFNWKRWAIAASVLLTIGITAYFISTNSKSKTTEIAKTQQERFKNDILPGNQGAVLTLANGQTILLDSAANGVLTKEGNVNVTKQGQQIVYTGDAGAVVVYNKMSTQKGKQYMLLLADGSKAYLNAASSITYPTAFVGTERKVEVSGEVYFEVAHNAAMPFVVSRGETSVTVLGTHFNVKAYSDDDDIKVTLLEGSVRINALNKQQLITPGQQAAVSNDNISVAGVNTEKIMAWKNNLFWFDNEDMPSIMRELARWYDAEIVFEEKVTSRYGFVLDRKLPISKLLQVLELTGGVHFIIEGKKITVMK